jgi:hypothetical protein
MSPQEIAAAEYACAHALNRFYAGIDGGRFEQVAELMAADGIWYRQGEQLKGPSQALAALQVRHPHIVSAHLVCNTVVELTGPDTANVGAYVLVLRHSGKAGDPAVPPVPAPRAVLRCEDQLVRTPAGWRFLVKRSSSVFRSEG